MPPTAITSKQLAPTLGLYSHGMRAPAGELVVVAGQVGMDATGRLVGPGDVAAQTTQTYENIRTVLAAAGCTMRDVVRFQTFLTHASDIDGFMRARREVFPQYYADGVYPPNTILVVSRLVQPELLVEIEAMAVTPPRASRAGRAAGAGRARVAAATKRVRGVKAAARGAARRRR
jgi:2-iminobutanoate/2-iminopropanoate deaminase